MPSYIHFTGNSQIRTAISYHCVCTSSDKTDSTKADKMQAKKNSNSMIVEWKIV